MTTQRIKLTRGDEIVTGTLHPEGQTYAGWDYVNIRIDGLDYESSSTLNHTYRDADGWERELIRMPVELPKEVGSVVRWRYPLGGMVAVRRAENLWVLAGISRHSQTMTDAEVQGSLDLEVIYVPE